MALLINFFSSAQEISVTSFKALPNDMTARTIAPIKDANGNLTALIKLVSVVSGFEFEGGSLGIVKAVKKTGEYWVYVPEKMRTITVKHPTLGILRNYAFPEAISSGSVYEMKLVHGVVETTIIEHQILTEFVIITSEPTGAEVYLNNEAVGKTPFTADKPEGRYEWRVERHLYQTQAGAFDLISGTKVRLNLVLKPDFGTLQISSIPEGGAEILLDGLKLGKTTPNTIVEVPKGEHTITLTHEWYETISQKVVVEAGKTQTINLSMKPTFAELTVNAKADEELYINNVLKGKGKYTGRLAPGVYLVELRKPSHKPASKQITLQPGDVETLILLPTPIFSTLKVESTPMDAAIFLNGKAYGSTPNIIRELLIGEYDMELRLAGYKTAKKKISLKEGSMLEVNETLSVAVEKKIESPIIQKIEDDMVLVEGGTFTMGYTVEQGSDYYDDEKPAHRVTLSGFYISKYEVTQAQWREVMGSNPSYFKNCDNCPVEQVSWNEVQEFIRKLNQMTGKNYRLPTEAEWEYAARGGNKSRGYKYSGSNNIDQVAWHNGNSGRKTHPIGQKQPNELGLFDMSGNVWEWCSDWSGAYGSASQTNPKGPTSGSSRVNRGGSWFNFSQLCRVSLRSSRAPGNRDSFLGFRVVSPQ
jgi:formylglycine-generating enzyme required for sulfatase activity